ncbi:MAG: cysteine peptidase family C39 domain-containing protein [Planctomycetota bacterium]
MSSVANKRISSKWQIFQAATLWASMILCCISVWILLTDSRYLNSETSPKFTGNEASILDPQNPCGPVAVSVVTHYLKQPRSLAECNQVVHCDTLGRSSMEDLTTGLDKLGLYSVGLKLDSKAALNFKVPLILFVNGKHFAAALPHTDGKMVIIDPPYKPKHAEESELRQRWTGEALLISTSKDSLNSEMQRLGLSL